MKIILGSFGSFENSFGKIFWVIFGFWLVFMIFMKLVLAAIAFEWSHGRWGSYWPSNNYGTNMFPSGKGNQRFATFSWFDSRISTTDCPLALQVSNVWALCQLRDDTLARQPCYKTTHLAFTQTWDQAHRRQASQQSWGSDGPKLFFKDPVQLPHKVDQSFSACFLKQKFRLKLTVISAINPDCVRNCRPLQGMEDRCPFREQIRVSSLRSILRTHP